MNFYKLWAILFCISGSSVRSMDDQKLIRVREYMQAWFIAHHSHPDFKKFSQENISKLEPTVLYNYCISFGDYYLNRVYDYETSITWFSQAVELQNYVSDNQQLSKAFLGLAMAHHHIGKHAERDGFLQKAQTLLEIPHDISKYHQAQFLPAGSIFCIVTGYKYYIYYENSVEQRKSFDTQQSHLYDAQRYFGKAIEIANNFSDLTIDKACAYHGLGTIMEFRGKVMQASGNEPEMQSCFYDAINYFIDALALRTSALGENHSNVGRSHHKLARNYAILAMTNIIPEERDLYLHSAQHHYEQACAIFKKNNLPSHHPKHQELITDYASFKNQFKNIVSL